MLDVKNILSYQSSENETDGCKLPGKDVAMHVKNIRMTKNLNQ